MASGLDAFAQGLVGGYITGKKLRMAQEMHDAQMKEIKRKNDMQDALKVASADVKPTQVYTVTDPTGATSTYADKAAADEAAKGYGKGANVTAGFSVAGQTYTDKAAADKAAALQNVPLMKMKRQMAVAESFGDPQLAAAYSSAAEGERKAGQAALYNDIQQARLEGNPQAVIDEYNSTHAAGGNRLSLAGQPGAYVLRLTTPDGKTQDTNIGSMDNLFSYFTNAALNTSDNAIALAQLSQQDRLAKMRDATSRRGQDMSYRVGMANVGLSSQRLGLEKNRLDWTENVAPYLPKPISGVGPDGTAYMASAGIVKKPDGTYGLQVSPAVPTGMKPTASLYRTGLFGGMGFPGAGSGTLTDQQMGGYVSNTNFGAAGAKPAKPVAAPSPTTKPAPAAPAPAAPRVSVGEPESIADLRARAGGAGAGSTPVTLDQLVVPFNPSSPYASNPYLYR